jgi:DeoR/GlpR family transcriptional regulator of sugar metabolism
LQLTAPERRLSIIDAVERRGRVLVSELSARFAVSEMTIRRDLEALEHAGAVSRVRGGAVPAQSQAYEPPFALRASRNLERKQRIGRAAADLVHDGETVILDAGTTTLEVARALRGRRNLRVLALSLRIAGVLVDEPGVTLMISGGTARAGEHSLTGSLAEGAFADLSFDTLVLTTGGIDLDGGVTEYNLDDAAVKRAAFASARRRIAVADASKLNKTAFARICTIDELDVLVTDTEAPGTVLDDIRAAGVAVVVA